MSPVILLHSSGLSGRQWSRLVRALEDRELRPLALDLTGHGTSPPWPEPKPFSFRIDVELIRALLDREGPAHLVGHSYGGLVSLHAALAAPAQVRSLVLFDPVAFGVLDPSADQDARHELFSIGLEWGSTSEDHEARLVRFVEYWGGPGAWTALKEDIRAEFRRTAWVVQEGVRSLMEDRTPASTYAALGMPVTLMTSANSPIAARRVIQRLSESIPSTTTSIVPEGGHLAPVTHPHLVNPLILTAVTASGRS
jgi:pimeloyl-ACP methyl ester carboxylesterase